MSVRAEQGKQRASELTQDVQARESEMAVRCEPERSGLEALRERQEQLQVRESARGAGRSVWRVGALTHCGVCVAALPIISLGLTL